MVREFLEYFGLDYTISVYDPETYFGKEYNYVGRNKLCEELGIDSTEPLLGEILKNSINGAFNSSQKVSSLFALFDLRNILIKISVLNKIIISEISFCNKTFQIN